jgi:hypothetical protein
MRVKEPCKIWPKLSEFQSLCLLPIKDDLSASVFRLIHELYSRIPREVLDPLAARASRRPDTEHESANAKEL